MSLSNFTQIFESTHATSENNAVHYFTGMRGICGFVLESRHLSLSRGESSYSEIQWAAPFGQAHFIPFKGLIFLSLDLTLFLLDLLPKKSDVFIKRVIIVTTTD